MRRLFIGLAPPIDVAEALCSAARTAFAPHDAERLRFTTPGDVHLTLLFLGGVAESAIPALKAGLERALSKRSAIELEIDGMGAFPTPWRPRILWAGVRAVHAVEHELDRLRAEIAHAAREAGVGVPERETEGPFHAHLTLARARSAPRRDAAKAFFEITLRAQWRADEVVLFQSGAQGREGVSTSRPEAGARYIKLERYPLIVGSDP